MFRIRRGPMCEGGVGDPLERPVELVRRDVEYGYVSAQSARDDYGVVLHPTTFTVDEPATAALRDERRRTPVAP